MAFRQRVLLLAFLILLVYGVSVVVVGPCVTSIEESFHVSHSAMGWMFAAGSIGYLFGVRLGGRLAGALGLSLTLRLGLATLGAGLLTISATPLWPLCVAGHCLSGIGGGLLEPALVSSAQVLYGEKPRAALNLSQVGFGLGAVAGPFLAKVILGVHWSWRLAFAVSGAATLGLIFLFPRQPIPSPESVDEPRERARDHTRNPVLWLMFLALMFYVGGELGLTSWASAYFEKTRGATKEQASLAPLFLWLGLLGGRMGMWFVHRRHSSRAILILCSLAGVVFSTASLLSGPTWVSHLLLTLTGIGLGPIWPTTLDHSANRLRTQSTEALSWIMIGGGVGALSQALLGHIADARSLPAALAVAVGLLGGATGCFALDWLLERRESRQ